MIGHSWSAVDAELLRHALAVSLRQTVDDATWLLLARSSHRGAVEIQDRLNTILPVRSQSHEIGKIRSVKRGFE